MSRTTHMIAQCRHLLVGDAARRALLGVALVVLVVQFGLVQHSIEHGAPFPDTGCEACVAGVHHVPLPAVGAPVIVPATAAVRYMGAQAIAPARKLHAVHLARGPPALS